MVIAALPTFRTEAFIDGPFQRRRVGRAFVTENPATGRPIATSPSGGAADIDAAVRAARRAFDDGRWSRRAPAERKEVLLRFADLLEANLEELALLDSLEGGKPITDSREVDLPDAVRTFRWFAEAIDKLFDAVAPTGPDALGLILREPIGVVGAVVPWNFPLLMATWKVAPALAAGNTMIVKPSRLTSLSAIRMAEIGVRGRAAGRRPERRAGARATPAGARPAHGRRHGHVHRLDRNRPPVPALLRGEQPQGGRRSSAAARARRSCWPMPPDLDRVADRSCSRDS